MIRCTEVESSAEWNTNSFPLDTGAGSHHFIQLDLIELETSHRFLEETLGNWGKKKPNKKQKCIQSPENGTGKWNTGDPNSLATIKPRCHVSACLLSRSALPNQRPGRVETIPTIEFPSSACHLPQSSLTPSG